MREKQNLAPKIECFDEINPTEFIKTELDSDENENEFSQDFQFDPLSFYDEEEIEANFGEKSSKRSKIVARYKGKTCLVPGCSSKQGRHENIQFFRAKVTRCRIVRIFLSPRFYVKSIVLKI